MLESLQTESSDVQSFFESMNLNSTAFAELGTVMGGLGGDEAELQDYFQLLFTSTEATALLVASVGSDGAAQQAVTDALDGNTEVRGCVCVGVFCFDPYCTGQLIALWTESLGGGVAGKKKRRRRQAELSNKQIKILIKQFGRYVKKIKQILTEDGLYDKLLQIESLLGEDNCARAAPLLEEVTTLMESSRLENWVSNAVTVKLELLINIDAVIDHKQSFKFWRFLSLWAKNTVKITRGYLIIELAGKFYIIINDTS